LRLKAALADFASFFGGLEEMLKIEDCAEKATRSESPIAFLRKLREGTMQNSSSLGRGFVN